MQKLILSMVVVTVMLTVGYGQNSKKVTEVTKEKVQEIQTNVTFGVRGNCGMCKTTIEKAANAVEGVSKATWNKDSKEIDVSFDASKTNLKTIHKAIAASGYDTDLVKASNKSYQDLAGCCQYNKDMKIGEVSKKEKKGCCAGKSKATCGSKNKIKQ